MNDEIMSDTGHANIALNLSYLAGRFSSIAEFCRTLSINRQQFNKYAAGQHNPARKIIQRIAQYFAIEPEDLLLPTSELKKKLGNKDVAPPFDLSDAPVLAETLPLLEKSLETGSNLPGIYYKFHNCPLNKGTILKSIVWIYSKSNSLRYVTLERFVSLDGTGKFEYKFTYHGVCTVLADRIFMVDIESKLKNEISTTILSQQHRRPNRFFYGLYTGVAATSSRPPFSTRTAFQYVSSEKLQRHHLYDAAILDPENTSIPLEIRKYLNGTDCTTLWGNES